MQTVRELMTRDPVAMDTSAPLTEAAARMRDQDVGSVIVCDNGKVCGIVTDRDIVIRALAEGKDPQATTVGEISSTSHLVTVKPTDSAEDAIRVMRENTVRRVPVVENDQPVGVLSLGDLAESRDPKSVLGEISSAPPNR